MLTLSTLVEHSRCAVIITIWQIETGTKARHVSLEPILNLDYKFNSRHSERQKSLLNSRQTHGKVDKVETQMIKHLKEDNSSWADLDDRDNKIQGNPSVLTEGKDFLAQHVTASQSRMSSLKKAETQPLKGWCQQAFRLFRQAPGQKCTPTHKSLIIG